jgi:dTDP-4-amino-4,6-dideoxygalactose transaminase
LDSQGISTVIHYPIPPHRQACYQEFNGCSLPIAETLADEVLSFPISPAMKFKEVEFVASVIRNFLEKKI